MHSCQASEEIRQVYVCVRVIPACWRAHSDWELCGLAIKANWIHTPYHETKTKALKETGQWVFYVIFVGPLDYNPTTDLPFLLTTKREHHKSLCVLLHLTQWKAYVLPSCLYFAQKMDCRWGLRKHPCPLECVTMPSNKIPCQGSSLFGIASATPPTPTLFCHFKHVTLMFQTHFSNVLHSI